MTEIRQREGGPVRGESRWLPIRSLRLDPRNPRLPAEKQGEDQASLLSDIVLGFDALTVAESIARHGFFVSEPLIAIPSDDEPGAYVVVEGNRRLAAMIGLANRDSRRQFASAARWEELAAAAGLSVDDAVPVVVEPNRQAVTPVVGFRHISGILQWQPYAQARYIDNLVDVDGMSYIEIAETVGIDKTRVANLYRDQAIAEQAKEVGVDVRTLERSFSLLTVAMSITKLRNHVGAPMGAKTVPGEAPISDEKIRELRELLVWIFGEGARLPLVTDSRQISNLGNVVANPAGLEALRRGESLDQAQQRIKDAEEDPRKRLLLRLRAGRNSLRAAADDIAEYAEDDEVAELVEEAREAVDTLQAPLNA